MHKYVSLFKARLEERLERRNHELRKYHQEREQLRRIEREREEEENKIKEMEIQQRKEMNRLVKIYRKVFTQNDTFSEG